MSIAVDVSAAPGRLALARRDAAALAGAVLRAEGVRDALLSLAFVSTSTITALNRKHLRRPGATDVISFWFARPSRARGPVVGDVYIAPEIAREQARRLGVPLREELARLVVHGTLHVLGHDHPEGGARTRSAMWRRQEALLRRFGGPRS